MGKYILVVAAKRVMIENGLSKEWWEIKPYWYYDTEEEAREVINILEKHGWYLVSIWKAPC